MKYNLLPTKGSFYKANMHTHTTVSDGKMTPEEIKQTYVNAGYSIVAFTDHEVIANHGHLTDDRFLAITAYEYAINENCKGIPFEFFKTYHLNLFSKEPQKTDYRIFSVDHANLFENGRQYIPKQMEELRYPSSYSTASVNEVIRIANEDGFLVSLNHPVWSQQNYEDYADLHGLWGVELYNTGCANTGYIDTPVPLDTLLRKGEKPFPLATDDAHSIGDCLGGWLMVSAEKLEYTAVMSALEKGDFYASTGPEIKEISFEDGKLTVRTSGAVGIFVSTDRRASYFKRSEDGALIDEAVFDLRRYVNNCALTNTPHYVRVTVRDREGRQAWSRAYFIDELI